MPRRRRSHGGATAAKKKRIGFHDQLWLSDGTHADWPHFARWHYRSHALGPTRRLILLWHGDRPIGICAFGVPAASLALRTRFFGLRDPRRALGLRALNAQLWVLRRVVLHPTYRGAGIAAAFVRRACELCLVDWIETLTAMGRANPFFERAGFVKVGTVKKSAGGRASDAFTGRKRTTGDDSHRFSEPIYYVRDNRAE